MKNLERNILLLLLVILGSSRGSAHSCHELFKSADVAEIEPLIVQHLKIDWHREHATETSLQVAAIEDDPMEEFAQETTRIRNQITENVKQAVTSAVDSRKIQTVLYPGSGFDGATPFLIFPDARVVIGVEQQPFVPNSDLKTITPEKPFERGTTTAWTWVDDVVKVPSIAGALIARMTAEIPGFRLRRATTFSTVAQARYQPNPRHGLIEFDRGPGTPVQYYIHYNGRVTGTMDPTLSRLLRTNGFQGVLIKASMAIFLTTSLKNFISEEFHRHGGVVGDADHLFRDSLEDMTNIKIHRTDIQGLGYRHLDILEFIPAK